MTRPAKRALLKRKTDDADTIKAGDFSKASKAAVKTAVVIERPKFRSAAFRIRGTSPYVQHKFAQKAVNTMMETQMAGSQAKKGKKRAPKNFDEVYRNAMHISRQGWHGIPASAFRNAAISACRTVGFKMTLAKLSLFVHADGFDKHSGDPLIKITKGKPHMDIRPARNDNGSTDLRARPMWNEGWEASVRFQWDEDQFSSGDVMNLLMRIGLQVGIGEGRADSKNSAGCGWGSFEVVT